MTERTVHWVAFGVLLSLVAAVALSAAYAPFILAGAFVLLCVGYFVYAAWVLAEAAAEAWGSRQIRKVREAERQKSYDHLFNQRKENG